MDNRGRRQADLLPRPILVETMLRRLKNEQAGDAGQDAVE
jgi:hypothetical protein